MSRSLSLKGSPTPSGGVRHILSIRTHDLVGVDHEIVATITLDQAAALYRTGRFVFGAHEEVMAKVAGTRRSGRLVLVWDQTEIGKPFALRVERDGAFIDICRVAEHLAWDLHSLDVEWHAPVEEWEAAFERFKAMDKVRSLRQEADEIERRYTFPEVGAAAS